MRTEAQRDIGKILAQQLEVARRSSIVARKRFDAVIRSVPCGLPHPDGAFRVEQAGKEARRALQSYCSALKRYADFVLCKTVPEDLDP